MRIRSHKPKRRNLHPYQVRDRLKNKDSYKFLHAFSLIELLIVVLILGALAVVAVPRIGSTADSAKINACKTNIKIINEQIELYMADKGEYPKKWDDFKIETDYFPDGPLECPFGEKYKIKDDRIEQHSH